MRKHYFTIIITIGEYSEENLQFWLEVEKFKHSEHDMLKEANCIYLTFVKPMSEKEVNISGNIRKTIAEHIAMEDITKELYDTAQSQVHNLMRRQSYPRFLLSDLLKDSV